MAVIRVTHQPIWMKKKLVGVFGEMMDPIVITRVASISLRILYFTIDSRI